MSSTSVTTSDVGTISITAVVSLAAFKDGLVSRGSVACSGVSTTWHESAHAGLNTATYCAYRFGDSPRISTIDRYRYIVQNISGCLDSTVRCSDTAILADNKDCRAMMNRECHFLCSYRHWDSNKSDSWRLRPRKPRRGGNPIEASWRCATSRPLKEMGIDCCLRRESRDK